MLRFFIGVPLMSKFVLGTRSLNRLEGVDDRLVRVVKRAIQITPVDFTVIEGKRTLVRQQQLYAQGRTDKTKPIVTWTMKSKHIEGLAVDIAPVLHGAIDWNNPAAFDLVAKAMFAAAKELGLPLRWGADWDKDGKPRERGETDSPHFEIG